MLCASVNEILHCFNLNKRALCVCVKEILHCVKPNSRALCTSVKEILHCVQNDKSRRDQKALGQEHGARLGDAVGQAPLINMRPVFLSGVKDLVGVFEGHY